MSDILSTYDESTFYDNFAKTLDHKSIDRNKQLSSLLYIPPNSCVLEICSKHGIVSCLINKILSNPKNHLVLESGEIKNRAAFKVSDDFDFTIKQLEEKYSMQFDVIVANCEDYLITYFDDDLDKIKLIIVEPLCECKHLRIEKYLTKLGFTCFRNDNRAIYINSNFLPFKLISYYSPNGDIGMFGKLGHLSKTSELVTDGLELTSVSLHAPSRLEIETKQELLVRGYASLTAEVCPILYFKVDDCQIGQVDKAGDKTPGYRLLPGKHVLGIHPETVSWAHSAWLFEKPKEIVETEVKYFNVECNSKDNGLMHQLINLLNTLTLTENMGRYIYNPQFLPNYNDNEKIPLSQIFNIDDLNKMFNSKIVTDQIDNIEWIKADYYNNLCARNSRAKILEILSNEKYPYLDLGDVYSMMLDRDSNIESIELGFYKNLPLVPEFYNILKYIQDDKYNVVHLRLEDDFVDYYSAYYNKNYEEYTKILVTRYLNAMDKIFKPEDKIYIASHLSKKDYPNNYVIDSIKEKYPNIISNINWRDEINLPQGREVDAIVDYLISMKAEKFIGIHGSTFSIILSKINKSRGKDCLLINPYSY